MTDKPESEALAALRYWGADGQNAGSDGAKAFSDSISALNAALGAGNLTALNDARKKLDAAWTGSLKNDLKKFIPGDVNKFKSFVSDLKAAPALCEKLKSDAVETIQRKELLVRTALHDWSAQLEEILKELDPYKTKSKTEVINQLTDKAVDYIRPLFAEASKDLARLQEGVEKSSAIVADIEAEIEAVVARARQRIAQFVHGYDQTKPWFEERRRSFRAGVTAAVSSVGDDIVAAIEEARQRLGVELNEVSQAIGGHIAKALGQLAVLQAGALGEVTEVHRHVDQLLGKIDKILERFVNTAGAGQLDDVLTKIKNSGVSAGLKTRAETAITNLKTAIAKAKAAASEARTQAKNLDQRADQAASQVQDLIAAVGTAIKEIGRSLSAELGELNQVAIELTNEAATELAKEVGGLLDIINQEIAKVIAWPEKWLVKIGTQIDAVVTPAAAFLDSLLLDTKAELSAIPAAALPVIDDARSLLQSVQDALAPDALLEGFVKEKIIRATLDQLFVSLPETIKDVPEVGKAITEAVAAMRSQLALFVDKVGDLMRNLKNEALTGMEQVSAACAQIAEGVAEVEKYFQAIGTKAADYFDEKLKAAYEALEKDPTFKNLQQALTTFPANAKELVAAAQSFDRSVRSLQNDLSRAHETARAYGDRVFDQFSKLDDGGLLAAPNNVLKLYSAVTGAPELAALKADIDRIRSDFDEIDNVIKTTQANALFNRLSDELKALGLSLPFDKISDQLFPADLSTFDIGNVFRNFGGAKLSNLLKDYKIPEGVSNAVRVTHDFDKKQARAWVQVDIDAPMGGRRSLFSVGVFKADFVDMHLTGQVRLEASKDQDKVSETGFGRVGTTIDLVVGGQSMVQFEKFGLSFTREKGLDVEFDPKNIRLNPTFKFIQDFLAALFPDDIGGLAVIKENGIPVGLQHDFAIPPMALNFGTSGVSNICIANHFKLLAFPDFMLANRFNLSSVERPFIFSIFIIGGTGYIQIDAEYRPFDNELMVCVEAGAGGSASLAFAFGPFSGQVFITLSGTLAYRKVIGRPGGGLSISAVLVIAGHVNVAGIVTVGIVLMLRMTYRDNGQIDADGTLTVEIRISKFFKITARAGEIQAARRQIGDHRFHKRQRAGYRRETEQIAEGRREARSGEALKMTISKYIHCLVDREPTAFHASDDDGTKASYAVNLSFEVRTDGTATDPGQEAKDAALALKDFLKAVRNVRFQLYKVKDPDPTKIELEYDSKIIDPISEPVAPADPDAIYAWLERERKATSIERDLDYWATKATTEWHPDSAVDINIIGASHRLRAAQAWNAPVAHKFRLTHIVQLPVVALTGDGVVVLPFFVDDPEQQTLPGKALGTGPLADEAAGTFDYNAKGDVGAVTCYTSIVAKASPLDLKAIYPGLTPDGYFEIDPEAPQVHRLLTWFEMRAASLLSANAALASRASNPDNDPVFENRFGVSTVQVTKGGLPVDVTCCSIVWYVVARLLSALDNVVIGVLKPLAQPANTFGFDSRTQGEVLAPLVSEMLGHLEKSLPDSIIDPGKAALAIRKALSLTSPLISNPSAAKPSRPDVVRALRKIYDIESPKSEKPKDALEFISLALACYEEARDKADKPQRAHVLAYAETVRAEAAKAGATKGSTPKGGLANKVSTALLQYEQRLVDEAGAEAAILKLFETADSSLSAKVATKYLEQIASPPFDPSVEAAVKAAFEQALAAYRTLLAGNFNGAEAIRRSASASFVRSLLDFASLEPKAGNTSLLVKNLNSSAFFANRVTGTAAPTGGCFDAHAATVVRADADMLLLTTAPDGIPAGELQGQIDALLESIYVHLEDGLHDFLAPTASFHDPDARFIPDSTPQPLAIEVAGNIDGGKIDAFSRYFNGIGLVIQRGDLGTDDDTWAHTHLADLTWTLPAPPPPGGESQDPPPDITAAIHPMLPAINDGRGPMFLEYHGFPFADRAFEESIVGNDMVARDPRRPFYVQDPHDAVDRHPRVPRLAYGRAFKTFSFITSNAGTLPRRLQDEGTPPWTPHWKIKPPQDTAGNEDQKVIANVDYQRRTAIAQMSVVEKTAGRPARIGALVDGVMPLAAAYPRVGLHAEARIDGVRDLLRDSDGRGSMVASKTSEWHISDIKISGQPKSLTVNVFEGTANEPDKEPGAKGASFVIGAGFAGLSSITIRIVFEQDPGNLPKRWLEFKFDGAEPERRDLKAGDEFNGWLRLALRTDDDHSASMSFANIGSQKSDNISQPLLILAPDKDAWKGGLERPVTTTVTTPRVSYLDFERWFANGSLFLETFGKERGEDPENNAGVIFMNGLATAYAMRKFDAALARNLESLPDPAVEKIRLELIALDDLTQATIAPVGAQLHELGGRLAEVANAYAAKAKAQTKKSPKWFLDNLLKPLDDEFRFEVTVQPGPLALAPINQPKARKRTASVPAGMVARLSMDTMVRAKRFDKSDGHYPSVIHRGLLQYASRNVYDSSDPFVKPTHVIFPATALLVETMYNGIEKLAMPINDGDGEGAIALAAAVISAKGIDHVRRFEIVAGMPAPGDQREKWRLLGEVDVITQRWRPSGRPIYHLVNPREHDFAIDKKPPTEPRTQPALPLNLDTAGRLAQFELEAFFDRSDVDAQTVTQRLAPLPASTMLQDHHWNPESATYFRHRFTLRSRYAGALLERNSRQVNAWRTDKPKHPLDTPAHGWTMRVAMLADLARIQLTRPQLRALIPLTTAPGGERIDRPAPPVAAILQEPPYARGGLADRIATEIKTGFGYGFEKANEPLEIRDAHKEAGRNAQLDYRALGSETALSLMLRGEGPIGLTFDNVDAPAPAFPNSMFVLKPDVLFGSKPPLEEFFAGITMRRYIDPAWTGAGGNDKNRLEAENAWWIDFDQRDTKVNKESALLQYEVEGSTDLMPLLAFKPDPDGLHIQLFASKLGIDGFSNSTRDWVAVATVTLEQFGKLSALHQQVAPARHALSIFVRTGSAKTERGEINTPLLVAGFEWSSPQEKKVTEDGGGTKEEARPPSVWLEATSASAFQTMASGSTFLRWTKTGRDFDFVHVAELGNNEWKTGPVHVRELTARLNHDNHEFLTFHRTGSPADSKAVWLCSSTFANPAPIHVHRHVGLISSRFLKELGTPVEVFCRTSADADAAYQLVTMEGNLRLSDGKIFKPQEEVVRIVEFETPAAILCAEGPQVPQTYKQAYFDLLSTGFRFEQNIGTAQLHFRFVGPPAQTAKFTEIRLNFWRNRSNEPNPFRLPVKFNNLPSKFAVGLRLAFKGAGSVRTYDLQIIYSDGTLAGSTGQFAEPDQFPLVAAGNATPGFFVSIDGVKGGSSEFWADISVLHSPRVLKPGISPLEFGWLFSPSGNGEPTDHVAAAGLTSMVEAQARIVAVSPPVPIISH
ncbi:hypothetical protein [Bradyrhizobium paxllaeri]|uniref:hypothetical protein n=1 Tax=Bradyrhizobium paxllaeri TaxID=190148 RepID=UPI00114629D9|nr:hypothetical protein [Bradyrhizobium paxllaeri]